MQESNFSFTLDTLDQETLYVVRFKGVETISELFNFEILLATENPDLDLATALDSQATLSVLPPGKHARESLFQGVLASGEFLHKTARYSLYLVTLVPSLQRLALGVSSRVFLDKDLKGIVNDVLHKEHWSEGQHYDLPFKQAGEPQEFVCQYQESTFHFLCRRLEAHGAFFFFDQGDATDKCVIADAHVFKKCPGGPVDYVPGPSQDCSGEQRMVHEFARKLMVTPGQVAVRDVNYRLNTHHVLAQQKVHDTENADPAKLGELHLFAPNAKSEKQGMNLARIAAQRLACEREQFHGASHCPDFRPGRILQLQKHEKDAFNTNYLITHVVHHGHQEGRLARTIGLEVRGKESGKMRGAKAEKDEQSQEFSYSNTFTAIPEDVTFRPAIKTRRPSIHGAVCARIDAEGSSEYAEVDEHGRYKVILPFDLSGRKDGKASAWLRMCQPYTGADHGMHLPLHKDCEVALLFHNGDPDRPVIAGALPNPANLSPVTSANATQNTLSTAHGNALCMEDARGSQCIRLHNESSKTTVRLGADNTPVPDSETTQPKPTPPGSNASQHNNAPRTPKDTLAKLASLAAAKGGSAPRGDSKKKAGSKKKSKGFKAILDWLEKTKRLDPAKSPGKHGLQFDTPDWFSVYAGVQSSIFIGEYTSTVLGSYNSAVLGLNLPNKLAFESLVPGVFVGGVAAGVDKDVGMTALTFMGAVPSKLKFNVALEVNWNVLEATTLRKAGKEINLFKSKTDGEKAEASGRAKNISANKDHLSGETTRLIDEKESLVESNTELKGEVEGLANDVKALKQQKNRCAAHASRLAKEKQELIDNRDRIRASVNQARDSKKAIQEEINRLVVTYNIICDELGTLEETRQALASTKTVTAGELNALLGEYAVL